MASALRGVLVSVALLNAFNLIICSSNFVPVVLWKTSSLGNDLPPVSALDKLSRNEFEDDLIEKLNRRGPVLFFLQDDLSLEDFTIWGDIYGNRQQKNSFTNVQKFLERNPSMLFPAVESPEDSISALADGRTVVEVNRDGTSSLSSKDLDNSLLIYRLPSTETAENRQQALSKNDQIINDAIEDVVAKSPSYMAIYTAQHSSWVSANEEHIRSARHVLAAPSEDSSNNGTFFGVANCYALYFDTIVFVQYKRTSSDPLTYSTETTNLTGSDFTMTHNCNESETLVWFKLKYSNPTGNLTDMELLMQFSTAIANDWILSAMNITYTFSGSVTQSNDLDLDSNFWAPMNFSYHCGQQTFMNNTYNWSGNDRPEKGGVTFGNLQVQPFTFQTPDMFGDPFDCVGFFTIGIWMTIFITAILILILGFGIHMTISIETMDRFDDPKGKTITVNASD